MGGSGWTIAVRVPPRVCALTVPGSTKLAASAENSTAAPLPASYPYRTRLKRKDYEDEKLRLQIELPPGAVLTGLSRRVFEQGTVIACEGARLDTLQALLQEEERRHR